jgi:hypothetical protein
MRIVISSSSSNTGKANATVQFESGNSDAHDVWFHIDGHEIAVDRGDAFLCAAYIPAWLSGEKAISVNLPVSKLFVANLSIAAEKLRAWDPRLGVPPEVLCDYADTTRNSYAAGIFLSGGVDSTASLRKLTTEYAVGDARRPKYAMLLDYQSIGGVDERELSERFDRRKVNCGTLAKACGVELVSIRTNIRVLNGSMTVFMQKWHGAILASVAHALSSFIGRAYISATYDFATLAPWGSHPALDFFYSSDRVDILHTGHEMSRLDKVRVLSAWPEALAVINVCTSKTSGGRNCGRCEKCVRTRLELLAVGSLQHATAFDGDDIQASDIARIRIGSDYARSCHLDVLGPLERAGRQDLVDAIQHLLRRNMSFGQRMRRVLDRFR